MSYYRHVKNWLLDTYPKHRATIEKKLPKMVQALERHCLKRVEGGMIKKAPACTKEDLRIPWMDSTMTPPAPRTTKMWPCLR
ncbi:hypothetical protein PI125_g19688 [Phytophthora idaei]|nr:hypothetical protein PI125_g19688 [Phytophthora idaei]KAG3135710.1 hypothetical protein PI126_g18126 [Phytophthora idaei]